MDNGKEFLINFQINLIELLESKILSIIIFNYSITL